MGKTYTRRERSNGMESWSSKPVMRQHDIDKGNGYQPQPLDRESGESLEQAGLGRARDRESGGQASGKD